MSWGLRTLRMYCGYDAEIRSTAGRFPQAALIATFLMSCPAGYTMVTLRDDSGDTAGVCILQRVLELVVIEDGAQVSRNVTFLVALTSATHGAVLSWLVAALACVACVVLCR